MRTLVEYHSVTGKSTVIVLSCARHEAWDTVQRLRALPTCQSAEVLTSVDRLMLAGDLALNQGVGPLTSLLESLDAVRQEVHTP